MVRVIFSSSHFRGTEKEILLQEEWLHDSEYQVNGMADKGAS
jgi:hypothetical protein